MLVFYGFILVTSVVKGSDVRGAQRFMLGRKPATGVADWGIFFFDRGVGGVVWRNSAILCLEIALINSFYGPSFSTLVCESTHARVN